MQALARARAQMKRFVELLPRARDEQRRFLLERVRDNATTAFGVEHGFASVRDVDDYRRAVPIRDYDAIAPWIERAAAGERGVLTVEDPVAFLGTSGTTGRSKQIPHTPLQGTLETFAQWIAWGALLEQYPALVERDDTTIDLGFDPRPPAPGSIPHGASSQMTFGAAGGRDPMTGFPGRDAPWSRPPADLVGYDERLYYRLRRAVEHDVLAIASINPSSLVVLAHALRRHRERIVRDVADGNPARARELEQLGPDITPRQIWPDLKVLRCWTAASAANYLPEVRAWFGEDIDVWPYLTIATEGAVAVPLGGPHRLPVLLVHAGFFELVPAADTVRPDSPTLLCHELELGGEYHLIQTRANGLYRYDVGDRYRVVELVAGVPCLEFIGRGAGTSSFTGEKLTESQVVAATAAALRECGLEAINHVWFACWGDPPYYRCFVEPRRPWSDADVERLRGALDAQLGAHNDEYPSKRASARLGPVAVELAAPGTFLRYWEDRVARGAAASQVKEPALQRDEALLAVLRSHGGAG